MRAGLRIKLIHKPTIVRDWYVGTRHIHRRPRRKICTVHPYAATTQVNALGIKVVLRPDGGGINAQEVGFGIAHHLQGARMGRILTTPRMGSQDIGQTLTRTEAEESGAALFLTKPFSPTDLLEEVRKFLPDS